MKQILIQNFSGLKSLALNFYKSTGLFSPHFSFGCSKEPIELIKELISYFKDLTALQISLVA